MTNIPIKDAALAYTAIEKLVLTKTSAIHPLSIQQIFEKAGVDVQKKQQVVDCTKNLRDKKLIAKRREGKQLVWWAISPMSEEQFAAYLKTRFTRATQGRPKKVKVTAQATAVPIARPIVKTSVPDIKINDDCIVIEHAKCRITIEFTNS